MFCALLLTLAAHTSAEMVQNWKASIHTPSGPEFYKVVMEWDHNAAEAVDIGWMDTKTSDDPRCSGSSSVNASDGQPFWMPRFFPRPVSSEITALTGIQFVSADWQPCGHKDITICHGESHYDFHIYYVPETKMNSLEMCTIGTKGNPALPVCEDSSDPINKAYFNLIDSNMPTSAMISGSSKSMVKKDMDFCVDPSSAILRSGVHYGDKSETLDEWKTPVTIIGSHDCQLKFFEPMVSWNWISGKTKSHWPTFNVTDITYNNKTFEALPHSWSVSVSEGCKNALAETCHLQITVEGTKCPSGGCDLKRQCGNIKDCKTGKAYTFVNATSSSSSSASSGSSSSGAVAPRVGASCAVAAVISCYFFATLVAFHNLA